MKKYEFKYFVNDDEQVTRWINAMVKIGYELEGIYTCGTANKMHIHVLM